MTACSAAGLLFASFFGKLAGTKATPTASRAAIQSITSLGDEFPLIFPNTSNDAVAVVAVTGWKGLQMTAMVQNAKGSRRANLFRVSTNSRHCSVRPIRLFRANKRRPANVSMLA
jgi:hypothetical protein